MSKIRIVVIIAFLVGVGASVAALKFLRTPKTPMTAPVSPGATVPSPSQSALEADATYEDKSGFSFKYPQDLTIADETPAAGSYYSLLTLKRGSEQMKLSIKDTGASSIESWLAKESDAPRAPVLVGSITFGDLDAKQYSANGKLYTIAVSDGVAYSLIGIKDAGYWEKVQRHLLATLVFAPPTATSSAGSTSQSFGSTATDTGDVIYEPEEIVQ